MESRNWVCGAHSQCVYGRLQICSEGRLSIPRKGGGGWAAKSKSQFCSFLDYADGLEFFLQNFCIPLVCVQNDQRVMGVILRFVYWGTH